MKFVAGSRVKPPEEPPVVLEYGNEVLALHLRAVAESDLTFMYPSREAHIKALLSLAAERLTPIAPPSLPQSDLLAVVVSALHSLPNLREPTYGEIASTVLVAIEAHRASMTPTDLEIFAKHPWAYGSNATPLEPDFGYDPHAPLSAGSLGMSHSTGEARVIDPLSDSAPSERKP